MKKLIVLIVLATGFILGGCADRPILTDEEYNRARGPAPNSPDFSGILPGARGSSQGGGR
jgi:hypothetical protein